MAKKPPKPPLGAPAWMTTYSDMVTLLLTFFVLLLSFAQTETSRYESVVGSIKDAFGGNVLQFGQVAETGKSYDNIKALLDSKDEAKPFPIDFLSTDGFLDKLEINHESEEDMNTMRKDIEDYNMGEFVDVYRSPEGTQMKVREDVIFEFNSNKIESISIDSLEHLINMLKNTNWKVVVSGYSSNDEDNAIDLSASRSLNITKALITKGVDSKQIITNFYGPSGDASFRKVDFVIRRVDGNRIGQRVYR